MFLVTTAVESTWNTARPILFLGEWCKRFSRRDFWGDLDNSVLPYHWSDREKFNLDYQYLGALYERYLAQFSDYLGRMHGVTSDIRYWRVVLGPWLRFFIDAAFDRYETVRTAAECGQVSDTWVLPYRLEHWVPGNFNEFYRQFTDDPWNHVVFAECIEVLGLPFTKLSSHAELRPAIHAGTRQSRLKVLAGTVLGIYRRLLPPSLNRIAIIASNLPSDRLCRLQTALGQLPYPKGPNLSGPGNPVNASWRQALAGCGGNSPFENFLGRLIAQWMPKSCVEDFADLRDRALAEFPKQPRLIFTANAYQADDGFKLWAAEQCSRGVRLVIGQHGGNLGNAHHNQTEDHQVRISDVFASWGWGESKLPNIKPMPSLQLSRPQVRFDERGDILLTLASLPRYYYCHFSFPVAGEFLDYIRDQIAFVERLDATVRERLRIRLNGDAFGWDISDRLRSSGLGGMIDYEGQTLRKRLDKSRLCITSYNATVYLETLAANFPTLAFWNPRHFDLRPEAEPLIACLRSVRILHETPESAASMLNSISQDVGAWWNSADVQAARMEFIRRYALVSDDWLEIWTSQLKLVARDRSCVRPAL